MYLLRILGIIFVVSLIGSCQDKTDYPISSVPFAMEIGEEGELIKINGKWVETTKSDNSPVTINNTVRIQCNRANMRCYESIALITLPNENFGKYYSLHSVLFEYRITSWNNNQISALSKIRVGGILLSIDLDTKRIERNWHEECVTENGSKKYEYHWILN